MGRRSNRSKEPQVISAATARSVPVWMPVALVIVTLAAYVNSLGGDFLFDDHRSIENNVRIRHLLDLGTVLSGRRPIMDLALAINHALGGLNTTGYHIGNLLIHILCGLVLFGLLRRVLQTQPFAESIQRSASAFAFVASVIWLVHPLQTESVTYLVQRSEALMGLFYLLTLYCVLRGHEGPRGRLWNVLAVLCCALGMGSKAVMVTAPLVTLLFDRAFLTSSWGKIIRTRWSIYLGLSATWLVLIVNKVAPRVLFPAAHLTGTVGFAYKDVTPWEYLLTQSQVIWHYVWLAIWPSPLCLDYQWPVARSIVDLVPGIITIPVLLVGTAVIWFRKPHIGFLGVWFFFILAPTSSIIPIKDAAFEHRMYLPLAAVVVFATAVVVDFVRWLANRLSLTDVGRRRLSTSVVTLVVLIFVVGTVRRNPDYRSEISMWSDVVEKRPRNTRALYNLGRAYLDRNELDDAEIALRRAVQIDPNLAEAYYNLGKVLARKGEMTEAAAQYANALRVEPKMARARSDLANILVRSGRVDEAIRHYRQAILDDPKYVRTYVNLASVLLSRGESVEAIALLHRAAELEPDTVRIRLLLGQTLQVTGDTAGAVAEFRHVLQIEPNNAQARQALQALENR